MYSIFLSFTTKTNRQYDEGNVLKTWSHSLVWRLEEGHGGTSKWPAVWRAFLPEPGTPNTDGDAQGAGHPPKALKAAAGPCETHFLFLPWTPRRSDWARKHHKETANPAGGGSEYSNWWVPACSVARSCPTLWDPMDYHPPGSSVHGILRQEYWNTGVGCHFLLQRIFLDQGSNPCLLSLLHWQAGGFFTTEPPGKPITIDGISLKCYLWWVQLKNQRPPFLLITRSFKKISLQVRKS